jgi:hypothetical protein
MTGILEDGIVWFFTFVVLTYLDLFYSIVIKSFNIQMALSTSETAVNQILGLGSGAGSFPTWVPNRGHRNWDFITARDNVDTERSKPKW